LAIPTLSLAAVPLNRATLTANINNTIISCGIGCITGAVLNTQLNNIAASMATLLDPNTFSGAQTFNGGAIGTLTGHASLDLALSSLGSGVQTLLSGTASGTGGLVGSISPTLTGTLTAMAANFSGNIGVNETTATLFLNKTTSGSNSQIIGETGGLTRWIEIIGNSTTESGSNIGSDFALCRASDIGTVIDCPMGITRSTGAFGISDALNVAGATILSGQVTIHSTLDAESNPTPGNPAFGIPEEVFIGTVKSVNTSNVALDALQIKITDTAGSTDGSNFIEGIRSGAVLVNNSSLGSAEAGIFAVDDQGATNHQNLIASEHDVFNFTETAPSTSALNCSTSCVLSFSILGGSGQLGLAGTKAIDAIFAVNPYPSTSAAQSGFLAAGNGLIFAGFADISTTANFGVDLAYATHNVGAIHIKNNEAIFWDTAAHAAQEAALYLDTNNNFHIGQSTASILMSTTLGLTPATWTDTQTCTVGWISVDANFVYVCTATNTVKRAALSTF